MTVFWGALVIWSLAWFIFALKNIFSFGLDWLVVDIICLSMGLANLLGYLKCANAARTLTAAATNYAVNYAVTNAAQRVISPQNGAQNANTHDFN